MKQHENKSQNWSEIVKNLENPLQKITELTIKTAQNCSFIKQEDLLNVKKPEELLNKQVNIAIDNAHKALDYFKQAFEIMEGSLLSINSFIKNKAETSLKPGTPNPFSEMASGLSTASSGIKPAKKVMKSAEKIIKNNKKVVKAKSVKKAADVETGKKIAMKGLEAKKPKKSVKSQEKNSTVISKKAKIKK